MAFISILVVVTKHEMSKSIGPCGPLPWLSCCCGLSGLCSHSWCLTVTRLTMIGLCSHSWCLTVTCLTVTGLCSHSWCLTVTRLTVSWRTMSYLMSTCFDISLHVNVYKLIIENILLDECITQVNKKKMLPFQLLLSSSLLYFCYQLDHLLQH